MRKILVPVDFSVQSIDALQFTLQLEKSSKSEVHLLHVVELPAMHDAVLLPTLSFEKEVIENMKRKTAEKFNTLVRKFSADGNKLKSTILFGSPHRVILDYIHEHAIDLVVMGSKGASGLKEIFVGSNTEKIVRSTDVPVITIKEGVRYREIKNIVFPNVIESDSHEDLVTKIKTLQHSLHAQLHIVYINTPLNFKKDIISRKNMAQFVKRYMLRDCTTHVFNDMEEEVGIINFASMIGADLIAIGTHGRKGLAHVLSGSLAEDIVNHAALPVWTYAIQKETKQPIGTLK